jgi:glucose-6-phosphate dehydrogenase assembly protein OpcA
MPNVFASLPGVETPVNRVLPVLAAMWEVSSESGSAPSEFRASQMNLVLHFGIETTPEDARAQLNAAIAFSHRYPARIIALCPRRAEDGGRSIVAKIYAECYIGKSRHEMTCCESIILGYPLEERAYLENQVSILVESDLPLYYWPHRFVSGAHLRDYRYFLTGAKRVVIDSSVDTEAVAEADWPKREIVRDLVFARLLPVRQSIGQFLSAFPPAELVNQLQVVEISHGTAWAAEAKTLLRWMGERLHACRETCGSAGRLELRLANQPEGKPGLAAEWTYGNANHFRWSADFSKGACQIEAEFGGAKSTVTVVAGLLSPRQALAEAMFF